MNKTLMIAATLLTLGTGAAFAGDGDVYAAPAQVSRAPIAQQSTERQRVFPASTQQTTNIYGLFGNAGTTQGGEN